jgi:hypothetical protein
MMSLWKKNLLRWFLFYSAEMALATAGFIYGLSEDSKAAGQQRLIP